MFIIKRQLKNSNILVFSMNVYLSGVFVKLILEYT